MLATPAGSNVRWNDNQLVALTDRAQKRLVAETRFPETRLTLLTDANQQWFVLPDLHVVHRVYLNGQPVVPVPGGQTTLEGGQILLWDQTGSAGTSTIGSAAGLSSGTYEPFGGSLVPSGGSSGGTTATPPSTPPSFVGSAIPPGSSGSMEPQWTVQTPTSYPFLNAWGAPAPEAQPWFSGQRPRYWIEGGVLFVTPAPAAPTVLCIDCVAVPATLTKTTDALSVPDNYLDGIVNYVMWRAASANAMSDRSPAAAQNRQDALNELVLEERKLRTWKRQFSLESDQTLVLTYRGAFQVGGNRVGDGWDGT